MHSYLQERSTVAANRLVKEKRYSRDHHYQTVRYLDENMIELYKQFPFRNEISKSTFVKYLKKTGQFKKPHRFSDLCEYCEKVNYSKLVFNT